MRINPLEVKHLNCKWCLVAGNFGPHKGKFICSEHNAFLRWAPKWLFEDDPDPRGWAFIERQKRNLGEELYEQGDLFFKIKHTELQKRSPAEKTKRLIDKLNGVDYYNKG